MFISTALLIKYFNSCVVQQKWKRKRKRMKAIVFNAYFYRQCIFLQPSPSTFNLLWKLHCRRILQLQLFNFQYNFFFKLLNRNGIPKQTKNLGKCGKCAHTIQRQSIWNVKYVMHIYRLVFCAATGFFNVALYLHTIRSGAFFIYKDNYRRCEYNVLHTDYYWNELYQLNFVRATMKPVVRVWKL